MIRFLFAIALIAVLAGCGPAAVNQAATPTPGETPDKMGGVAILFQRSGGLAGDTEQWAIYPDGRVITGDGQEMASSPDKVSQLMDQIQAKGFFDLADSYGLGGQCRDCYTYMLTVNSASQVKAVTAVDGAAETPPQVMEIIGLIDDLISGLAQP